MRRQAIVTVCIVLSAALAAPAWAADRKSPSPMPAASASMAQNLKGQIVKIEKEFYVIKDGGGKEVRLRVNQETVLQSGLRVGDMVDAEVGANGHALTLLRSLQ